jgi:YebC/PmpR family DNA-binding regulatory protein
MNLKLRYAIDKAREVSMPKDNIERAIKRGTGEVEGVTFEEVVYEGYLGGVAIIVETLTDNRNRTVSELNKIFERAGGKLGSAGSAAYLFERKGLFGVDAKLVDEDTLMSIALDAGADDLKRSGSSFDVTCDPAVFAQVQAALEKNNIKPLVAEITQLPKAPIDVDVDTGHKVMRLMEALDDHDDTQNVYSNVNISEEMVAQMK